MNNKSKTTREALVAAGEIAMNLSRTAAIPLALGLLWGCQPPAASKEPAPALNRKYSLTAIDNSVVGPGTFGKRPRITDPNAIPESPCKNQPRTQSDSSHHKLGDPNRFAKPGGRRLLDSTAITWHGHIGPSMIDTGSYGSNTDYFAAFQIRTDLQLPPAAGNEKAVLYAPTMIGADSCPLEIVANYTREPGSSVTTRNLSILDHRIGGFVWNYPLDGFWFDYYHMTTDGGRRMCEVYISAQNGTYRGYAWNYQSSTWNQLGTISITGTRSVYGTHGWCMYEYYLPKSPPNTITASDTTIEADYIQEFYNHQSWAAISTINGNANHTLNNENPLSHPFSYVGTGQLWHWFGN